MSNNRTKYKNSNLSINKLSDTPKMIDVWGYESKNFNVYKKDVRNLIS